jgi:hypothetical protein
MISNMNKTDLLFQMMEQPQTYAEQQWQEILSDEECRELYTLMAKTQNAFDVQKEIDDETIDDEWKRLTAPSGHKWLRVAAMFVGFLLVSGIAIAAIYMIQSRSVEPTRTEAEANSSLFTPHSSLQEPVRFSNASLDSVLSVVSHHYHHSVCFQNDTLRQLRFTIAWDSIQPLATFLENVNEFEGLKLIDARDTIFVNVEKEVQP